MAITWFILDGAYHQRGEGEALPPGAVEVPRPPATGESWNGSAFEVDHRTVANAQVPSSHIDEAHARKAAEAALIASGITLTHGLLCEEAAAVGIPLADLAAAVLAHDAEFRATEVARRVTIAGG